MEARSETEVEGEWKGREGRRQLGKGVDFPSPGESEGSLKIEERQDVITACVQNKVTWFLQIVPQP